MLISIRLSRKLVDIAKIHAKTQHRSVSKQIEYWSRVGKMIEENPDLTFSMIQDILIADQEKIVGEYVFN